MVVEPPAALALTTSAPPSTVPLSMMVQDTEVNADPAATFSTTPPALLVPVVVVDGLPTLNRYPSSHLLHSSAEI